MPGSDRQQAPGHQRSRTREVSRPGGADERAADHVAANVGPITSAAASARGGTDRVEVAPAVDTVLASGGQPLDPVTRALMEPRLRFDLGNVRIHADSTAAEASRSLRARAFTSGRHIVLGGQAPSPSTWPGRFLLAHELTHTAQSSGDGIDAPIRRDVAGDASTLDASRPEPTPATPGQATIPPEQKDRIIRRLEDYVAASEHPDTDEETPRQVAIFLVVEEMLDDNQIRELLAEIGEQYPTLMSGLAFGGRLFEELRRLGVVDVAVSAGNYLALTLRDTLAGDFVKDPTALAIVLRTLLTLIPGVDTVADIQDLIANLGRGVVDPAELATLGWWFTVLLTLIGLFPAFGTLIKGAVKLTVNGIGNVAKGIGNVTQAGLDAALPGFMTWLRSGNQLPAMAATSIGELLSQAGTLPGWVVTKFVEIIDRLMGFVRNVPGTLVARAAPLLATLQRMKDSAATMLGRVWEILEGFLNRALEMIGVRGSRRLPDDLDPTEEVPLPLSNLTDLDTLENEAVRLLTIEAGRAAKQKGEAIEQVLSNMPGDVARAQPWNLVRIAEVFVKVRRLRKMIDIVANAFDNPVELARGWRGVVERARAVGNRAVTAERRHIVDLKTRYPDIATNMTPEAAQYVAGMKQMAKEKGQGVVELHKRGPDDVVLVRTRPDGTVDAPISLRERYKDDPSIDQPVTGGFIDEDVFVKEVAGKGDVVLDYAALELTTTGMHGALTHGIQGEVADRALKAAGYTGGEKELRELIGWIQVTWSKFFTQGIRDIDFVEADPQDGKRLFKAGTIVWNGIYDRLKSVAQPERMWPPLRDLLRLGEREL